MEMAENRADANACQEGLSGRGERHAERSLAFFRQNILGIVDRRVTGELTK